MVFGFRFEVRQKRTDSKKALNDLLFSSGCSTLPFQNSTSTWGTEEPSIWDAVEPDSSKKQSRSKKSRRSPPRAKKGNPAAKRNFHRLDFAKMCFKLDLEIDIIICDRLETSEEPGFGLLRLNLSGETDQARLEIGEKYGTLPVISMMKMMMTSHAWQVHTLIEQFLVCRQQALQRLMPSKPHDCDCDWLPPQRIQNFNNERWTNRGREDKNHWRFTLKENGLRFSTEQELYDYYVHILARVLPNTAEAKKEIYIVTCEEPFGFGTEVDKIIASKVVHFPEVEDCDEDNFYEASYHYLSERNLEWDSDHWLINVTRVPNDKQARPPWGFAAKIDEDTLNKLKALPDVLQVLLDYSFDLKDELYEELHLFDIEDTMWRVLYIAGSQISTDYGYCND
ncbi:hypothetical protein IFM89_012788 [Coptis chinensis]|uniref:MORF/ORRM1/DAG-like MORF domain-containing protein n=1 Tax=Coptis chinensis TaxID=261450 RepID=A0A835H5S0_9MAGN|nr:hypothetical protein IFM89_012788 [Coptis chinensis]